MAVFFSLAFAPCQGEIDILTVENQNVNSSGSVGVSYANVLSLAYTTSDNGCSFSGATYNGKAVSTVTTGDSHVSTLDEDEVKIGCPDGDLLTVSCVGSGGASQDGEDTVRIYVSGASGLCPECGNGEVDTGEVCDDDNTANCDGCSSNCAVSEPLTCGDGIVCPPEQCDYGNGYCNPDCTMPRCGDGIINISEDAVFGLEYCDDGDATHCGACDGICSGAGIGVAVCGDGVVCGESWGETCDENEANAPNACTGNCNDTCDGPADICGDGIVRCGEECDDCNTAGADGCGATCQDEPRLLYLDPTILTTDLSKQIMVEGDGFFTNDRSVDLFWANAVVDAGVFTSLELVVTALTPCAPPFVVEIPMIQAGSGSPQWTVDLTRQGRSLPLCGGLNFIVFYVRDENGAVSNGFDPPVQIDSAWAEIRLVLPLLEPRVPGSTDLYLTRDDFAISGYTNLNSLDLRIRRNEGPDILLTPNMPDLYGPMIVGGANHGLYQFTQIPVDGAGHDTSVGFERHGSAAFEVLEQVYTLDPDILLVPVDVWIILGQGDTAGNAGNAGSDLSVGRAQASFDPEFDPALPVLPRMGDPGITGGTDDWMIDRIWAQANIQFHILDRTVNIHAAQAYSLALAFNPFAWGASARCWNCAACNIDDPPLAAPGDPPPTMCTNCTQSGANWSCEDCTTTATGNDQDCTGCTNCAADDEYFVHCCNYGYRGQTGAAVESGFHPGQCCDSPSTGTSCGNTDLTDGVRNHCRDRGYDVGASLGRTPGAMNVYYAHDTDRVGDGGGHGDWLPLAYRAGVVLGNGTAESRHVNAHEIGHYMSLSHVCERVPNRATNPGIPNDACCEVFLNRTCSDDQSQVCTPPAPGSIQNPPPPFGKMQGADGCLSGGTQGICIVNEHDCISSSDYTCHTNNPGHLMSQTTCQNILNPGTATVNDLLSGSLFDQSGRFEISIARQAIINSGIRDLDNILLELNP